MPETYLTRDRDNEGREESRCQCDRGGQETPGKQTCEKGERP